MSNAYEGKNKNAIYNWFDRYKNQSHPPNEQTDSKQKIKNDELKKPVENDSPLDDPDSTQASRLHLFLRQLREELSFYIFCSFSGN